ncbi:MAG: uracil-DNA glycosylase [Alphaproteobacteria bacterium]
MPNNPDESILNEAIKWLDDIGCYEPLNADTRSFHGLISKSHNSNEGSSEEVISKNINLEIIDNIQSLKEFLLSKNFISQSNNIFYEGSTKADLMVIGDKPEDTIIKNTKPFHGELEKLLDAMLKAIGFDKSNTYYTNLHFNITKIEANLDLELEIIKKQILIVKPKIIIMFGAEVTKLLTNTEDSIFKSRGKWYNIKIKENLESVLGISMFHPRYVLVHPESKKETWKDLKEVRKKIT